MEEIDIAIVGGGPTGLAAGLYAARAQRRTVLWERGVLGGQIAITALVENYPGFADGVQGPDLAIDMHRQAEKFGMETVYGGVEGLRRDPPYYVLTTADGEVRAKTVIVTSGADPVKLGVPGEEALTGRGVSYCATCDAAFFTEQVVAVVGGGDAALEEALFTTRYASHVYLIHRRAELRASKILQERALAHEKIEPIWNTVVEEVRGGENGQVAALALRDLQSDETRELPVDGVFIFIGHRPNTELLRGLVPLDGGGHAYVNLWMETEQPGLFVAGDVRVDSARQLATATGDGVTAAIRAEHYLQQHFD
ncbi:MAG: FAD-dependent oxidoreductase [Chloroflexi bacterium]|nr:FAD-dependent oxidoreductase [Chloroflexota bacterium]